MTDRSEMSFRRGPKAHRPAAHRCAACNAKVDPNDDDDMHVCVADEQGEVERHGQRWRATTAKDARELREKKVQEERDRGRRN